MNVKATAYHEAGHAVMTAACNRKIHSATIIPRDDTPGSVEHENPLRGIKLEFDNGYPARLRAEDAILWPYFSLLWQPKLVADLVHGRVRLTNNDRWFFIQLY